MITQLFIFFALPLATILLSIVLQRILRFPILVAITAFAIFLIVAFVAFSDTLAEAIIATIAYTIIAYITAIIAKIVFILLRRLRCCQENNQNEESNNNDNNTGTIVTANNFLEDNMRIQENNATMHKTCTHIANIPRRRYGRF